MLFEPYVRFHSLTEWSPTVKKLLTRLTICFLSTSTLLTHLGFWSGNFFLIAPFPDHCLLVPFHKKRSCSKSTATTQLVSRGQIG